MLRMHDGYCATSCDAIRWYGAHCRVARPVRVERDDSMPGYVYFAFQEASGDSEMRGDSRDSSSIQNQHLGRLMPHPGMFRKVIRRAAVCLHRNDVNGYSG